MNARNKLNAACVQGAFVFAGIGGVIAGSWKVFFLLLVALIGLMLTSGDIRLKPTSQPKRSGRRSSQRRRRSRSR